MRRWHRRYKKSGYDELWDRWRARLSPPTVGSNLLANGGASSECNPEPDSTLLGELNWKF